MLSYCASQSFNSSLFLNLRPKMLKQAKLLLLLLPAVLAKVPSHEEGSIAEDERKGSK